MKQMKYKVLHLPKTGGTTLKSTLIKGYKIHEQKYIPSSIINGLYFCDHDERFNTNSSKYIFFVRDPIKRFESHFNFIKFGQHYDTSKYFRGTKKNKPLVKDIHINEFVENDNSKNFKEFKRIHKSLRILINGNTDYENLFFVGTQENLSNDFKNLINKLNHPPIDLNKSYNNKQPNTVKKEKLNKNNIIKIRSLFNEDYNIIKNLVEKKFINDNYLREIKFDI